MMISIIPIRSPPIPNIWLYIPADYRIFMLIGFCA